MLGFRVRAPKIQWFFIEIVPNFSWNSFVSDFWISTLGETDQIEQNPYEQLWKMASYRCGFYEFFMILRAKVRVRALILLWQKLGIRAHALTFSQLGLGQAP